MGGAEFSWSIFNFQKEQDLRVKVGYDVIEKVGLIIVHISILTSLIYFSAYDFT